MPDEIKFNKNDATIVLNAADEIKEGVPMAETMCAVPMRLKGKIAEAGGFEKAVELCRKQWPMLA